MSRTAIWAPWVVLVLAVAAGCSEDAGIEGAATGPTTSPSSAASEPPPYDPGQWRVLRGLARCGPQPPRLADREFDKRAIRRPGTLMPAITAGSGPTVAVLIHQTDGGGFCGWLEFADRVASVPGQTALAFDLCGYAKARCRDGATRFRPQVEQVRLAIDHAVQDLGAERVVLVGASMGGSLAVLTAGYDDRVDAVVDLSGPDDWRGALVRKHAGRLKVPALVAMADDEGVDKVEIAQATADAAPEGEFLGAVGGHGYELLQEDDGRPTALSEKVLAWIRG